jgi:selenocysteine lyase/cysteine desulfurase
VPTAAAGLGIAARNLRPRAGQNVVVSADQFPSNVYPWRRWRAAGVSIRTVRPPAVDACDSEALCRRARTWNAMLLEAIDADTALVALEQAHWTDGTLFDLERIGERCRATGAAFVVDATQTAGAMTLDASAIRADALVVHAYKSMLSNYGLGFAVLGDRFAEGVPAEESWLTRRGSEDFSRLVDYQDDYAPGMRRYDTSLRANPVLIRMLEASCSLLLDWRPERIREYLLSIEREAVARLRAAGFGVADEDLRAANIFGIGLPPGLDPQACRAALAARRIHVAVRGACVRVSPHVCNDAADLDRLADALIDLARDLPRAHPAGR